MNNLMKFAFIMVNQEKLLLLLGIPTEHQGQTVKHEDAVVLDIKASRVFNGADICKEIDKSSKRIG